MEVALPVAQAVEAEDMIINPVVLGHLGKVTLADTRES